MSSAIASGAVVLTASADDMVKALDQSAKKIDAWGAKAQDSIKVSSARIDAEMAALAKKQRTHYESGIAGAMSAAAEKNRAMSKAMSGGNWDGWKARNAGWSEAAKSWSQGATVASGSMTKTMADMWAKMEAQKSKISKSMSAGNWSGVAGTSAHTEAQLAKGKEQAAARMKTMLEGIDKSAGKSNESFGKVGAGLGGIVKGLKLTETAGMGVVGMLTMLHKAAFDAFAMQHDVKLYSSLEESARLAAKLDESLRKLYADQMFEASRVDFQSWAEFQRGVKAATKSLDGMERSLLSLKDIRRSLEGDYDRFLGKATLGRIGIFDTIHKQQEGVL